MKPLEGTEVCCAQGKPQFHMRPGRVGAGSTAACPGLLHAENHCRSGLQRRPWISMRPVEIQSEGHRALSGPTMKSGLVIIVLNRPRHEELIAQIRVEPTPAPPDSGRSDLFRRHCRSGARRRRPRRLRHGWRSGRRAHSGRAAVPFGRDGGPAVIHAKELEERVERMGVRDAERIYAARDLAPGNQIFFAACGVTDGALLHGIHFFGAAPD